MKMIKDNIFKIIETNKKIYYACKGTKKTYLVIYDKIVDTYKCECKNIRLTDCTHIKNIKHEEG